jgi:hypothetical protein
MVTMAFIRSVYLCVAKASVVVVLQSIVVAHLPVAGWLSLAARVATRA